jgi:hypothetical protein
MFSDITSQLCHFYLLFQVPLKTGKDNLALAGLEAVDD